MPHPPLDGAQVVRSKQLPRSVADEQAPLTDVATHGGIRGMAGLLPDQMRRDARPRSRGNKTRPQ